MPVAVLGLELRLHKGRLLGLGKRKTWTFCLWFAFVLVIIEGRLESYLRLKGIIVDCFIDSNHLSCFAFVNSEEFDNK